jgi:hypothetical protein
MGSGLGKQANMIHTDFEKESMDAVIDKACFDALMCTNLGTVYPKKYLMEVERVLTQTGVYICISHAPPDARLRLLWQPDFEEACFLSWDVTVYAIRKNPSLSLRLFHIANAQRSPW